MVSGNEKLVMDAQALEACLKGLALKIGELEKKQGPYQWVGILTRGLTLAKRLAVFAGKNPDSIGSLDINLYRDDLSTVADMPIVRTSQIPFSVESASILLIDDVLYTGRTVRSALDALLDLGRPKRIDLLALVDRGGRELPIAAQFCGQTLDVQENEVVKVRFQENDAAEQVVVGKIR